MTVLSLNYLKVYNNTALVAQAPKPSLDSYPQKITECFKDIRMLQEHDVFSLKVENGHLAIKSLAEKVCYFFFGNKQADAKLQTLIGSIVNCYSKHMINPETLATHLNAKTFKTFIFEKIAKLDHKFFNRSDLFQGLEKEDRKEIQNILSEEIKALRQEVRHFKGLDIELSSKKEEEFAPLLPRIDHLEATSTLKCRSRMAKAALALRLGVLPSQNSGGSTESFVIRDVTGKKLGLYKAINDSTHKFSRTISFIGRWILHIHRQIHYCRNEGTLPAIFADTTSFVASEHFGVNMTPGSMRLRVNEKGIDGLFLTWCNGFTDALNASFPTPPKQTDLEQFQKMAAYDYFIGNLDRHSGNWMVNQDGEIRTIDNSNCFLDKNTLDCWSDQFIRKKQYAWKNHPFASYPLSPTIKAFIKEQFTETKISEFIKVASENLENQGLDPDKFLKTSIIERLQERGRVLREFALKEDTSPAILGSLYSDKAIGAFLKDTTA